MTLALQRETFGVIDFSSNARSSQEEALLIERGLSMADSPFDASPIAQCLLDRKMRFVAVNPAMSTVLGVPTDDLLGYPAATVVQGAEKMIERAFGLAETGRAIPQRKVEWRERQYGLSFNPVRSVTGRTEGLAIAAVDITRQWKIARRLRESRRKLLANSQHDHLTGLLNRRGFEAKLNRELRRMRREQATLSLLLLDIDAFKSFNDAFGHSAGDRCLEVVAATLRTCMRRPMDAACRYGGEEFAVILPNVDAHGAAVMAENCRKAVEELKISQPESPYGQVTISIGAATISPAQDRASTAVLSSALLDAADKALYQAKNAGRNRCVVIGQP